METARRAGLQEEHGKEGFESVRGLLRKTCKRRSFVVYMVNELLVAGTKRVQHQRGLPSKRAVSVAIGEHDAAWRLQRSSTMNSEPRAALTA
jgi:hypothetical protein